MTDIVQGYNFGLREIMLISADEQEVVSLRAPRMLSFTENHTNAQLEGADRIVATAAYPISLNWTLEEGGISLEALAIIAGESVTVTGVDPDQIETMVRNAGRTAPYFKILGRSLGDRGDSTHVLIPNAKITQMDGEFKYGEFFLTKCEGIALDEGDGLYVLKKLQTDAELSFP
jgi:hypothetical protein